MRFRKLTIKPARPPKICLSPNAIKRKNFINWYEPYTISQIHLYLHREQTKHPKIFISDQKLTWNCIQWMIDEVRDECCKSPIVGTIL